MHLCAYTRKLEVKHVLGVDCVWMYHMFSVHTRTHAAFM